MNNNGFDSGFIMANELAIQAWSVVVNYQGCLSFRENSVLEIGDIHDRTSC